MIILVNLKISIIEFDVNSWRFVHKWRHQVLDNFQPSFHPFCTQLANLRLVATVVLRISFTHRCVISKFEKSNCVSFQLIEKFENSAACCNHTLKTTVATQLYYYRSLNTVVFKISLNSKGALSLNEKKYITLRLKLLER
jgi:hypothetical protein